MNDLQVLMMYALEDMTLLELNKRYFHDDGGGIGYTKRLLVGSARPVDFLFNKFCAGFEEKYQEKLKKYREVQYSLSKGW